MPVLAPIPKGVDLVFSPVSLPVSQVLSRPMGSRAALCPERVSDTGAAEDRSPPAGSFVAACSDAPLFSPCFRNRICLDACVPSDGVSLATTSWLLSAHCRSFVPGANAHSTNSNTSSDSKGTIYPRNTYTQTHSYLERESLHSVGPPMESSFFCSHSDSLPPHPPWRIKSPHSSLKGAPAVSTLGVVSAAATCGGAGPLDPPPLAPQPT